MTPAARYAAAIDVLDRIGAGDAAEQALTSWARQNRFAGSKDRAAIRDHVFDTLRNARMCAALGGGTSGRARILGLLRQRSVEPDTVFGADTYAPAALSPGEQEAPAAPTDPAVIANLPDWLWPVWQQDLGAKAHEVAKVLTERAGVFLRVNLRRGSRTAAMDALAQDGIGTRPVAGVKTALEVIENPRRVAQSAALAQGLIELQDCSGQAAMARLADRPAARILDYCAGGGGKALALADLLDSPVTAHDAAPARMRDLPVRATRAGAQITVVTTAKLRGSFDLVLCDAPCSGSGTWRRAPQAKMDLTAARLDALHALQDEVLEKGAARVGPKGRLAYATCSVLHSENTARVQDFLSRHPEFSIVSTESWTPDTLQDGFFLAVMERDVVC